MNNNKIISIVVPVFNEQDNILVFYRAICDTMQNSAYDFELLFIDDGSQDQTAFTIQNLTATDSRVKLYMLSRNYGHQIALTCGLDHTTGTAIITMDGDMQHPPSLIPQLISEWEAGFEVVQTVRATTEGVSFSKRLSSHLYYKLINKLAQSKVVEGGSDFRLMDEKVVAAFRLYRERGRFIRGLIGLLGFKQKTISFTAPARFAGVSKFSLKKMLHFALDGVTAFSRVPLRAALYGGIICGGISFLLILHIIYVYLTGQALNGWTTLGVSILFLGGIQLIGIGIIGEYVGRVFEEVKQRPLYWVKSAINFEEAQEIIQPDTYHSNYKVMK